MDKMVTAGEAQELSVHAERVRASHTLGRSSVLLRLFDYLLQQSLSGKAPKEIEVAIEVFGKSSTFNAAQNALVRVSVHKLRRKLADYYLQSDQHAVARLAIPKGEYRLVLESATAAGEPVVQSGKPQRSSGRATKWLIAALCVSLIANAVIFYIGRSSAPPIDAHLPSLQSNPIWAPLFADDRPILVVTGDYFIFGELDDQMRVRRLIREFDINSPTDLEELQKLQPQAGERYANLDLKYLPVATGFALRDVLPVLATQRNGAQRLRMVVMSELTPEMLKSAHIVYVGYLSGLGFMKDIVFSRSRLDIGETYDEVVDSKTHRTYVSQAGLAPGGTRFLDYGYFSTFNGPTGNQIIIIAGTRDAALMQMSEVLTSPAKLDDLAHRAAGARAFESLYEVEGLDRLNLAGRLLFAAPLAPAQ
jgi:hypothetical protein